MYEVLIFLAAMIAYPAGWVKKLVGAGLGIPLLYVVNIIRMVMITFIGNWSPATFDFLHLYFWQVAMILIILAVWILWIEKVVHRREKLWLFAAKFRLSLRSPSLPFGSGKARFGIWSS